MRRKLSVQRVRNLAFGPRTVVWVIVNVVICGVSAMSQRPPAVPQTAASAAERPSNEQLMGGISGIVVDQTGSAVVGARVTLSREDQTPIQEVPSGEDGHFAFANIAPGPFQLTVVAASFNTRVISGVLHPGETYAVPQIVLVLQTVVTDIKVTPPRAEMAQYQLERQEKQRVLGFIPNFYVTYFPDTVPLSPMQKFHLAWKASVDPVTFLGIGVVAGVEQGLDNYSGYGQGMQGYAKRYGAAYADVTISTFIGSAALPALLKQDPRYFYKGTGSVAARFFYAIGNSVICKGDNGHWQANYSKIAGDFAAGGISNLYYPVRNRGGVKLTYQNALFAAGITAVVNILNEFLVPKLPSHFPGRKSERP